MTLADTADFDRSVPFFFVEQYLDGDFTRYSYNTGFWEESRLNEWLLRFALWTYEITDGFMMVADLQGVHTPSGFILTDPVVLCKDLNRFGSTNLGEELMLRNKTARPRSISPTSPVGLPSTSRRLKHSSVVSELLCVCALDRISVLNALISNRYLIDNRKFRTENTV